MKIEEVLKLAKPDLSGDARSLAADRTRTTLAPVQPPNRIVRLGSQDIFPDADPNHDVTDDLSLALHPPSTSPVTISPAHRRDLDFIKRQLARLPRHTEQ
jgi:hypothetical protein